MIQAAGLSKRYRKKLAVDDVSFEVATGKVTGFVGPNGAGKSTTMRLMLGLDNGQGSTLYDGKPLHSYDNPATITGVLLEAKAFHPTRTARNHLRVLAAASDIPEARVDEVLEIVGLKDVAKKKPGKFSLGMSQRLGIAAAILGNPKYLLLDEPANGLDPEGIVWLRTFIKSYARSGKAVFISSHLLTEMSQMADNVVVIGKGKLIASMPVKKMLALNGKAGVVVRSPKLPAVKKALTASNMTFTETENGILIHGATSDEVGAFMAKNGLPVSELATQNASLEEAFLDLTASAQEYQAGGKGNKK